MYSSCSSNPLYFLVGGASGTDRVLQSDAIGEPYLVPQRTFQARVL